MHMICPAHTPSTKRSCFTLQHRALHETPSFYSRNRFGIPPKQTGGRNPLTAPHETPPFYSHNYNNISSSFPLPSRSGGRYFIAIDTVLPFSLSLSVSRFMFTLIGADLRSKSTWNLYTSFYR